MGAYTHKMQGEQHTRLLTIVAAEDDIVRGNLVWPTGTTSPNNDSDRPVGVALNDADTGDEIAVAGGVVYAKADAAGVAAGAFLTYDTSGSTGTVETASLLSVAAGSTAVESTAADGEIINGAVPVYPFIGQALETIAAGELGLCYIY